MSDSTMRNGRTESTSPELAPATVPEGVNPPEDQFDAAATLLRLLVGGMLVGGDELRDRLARWQDATTSAAQIVPSRNPSDSLDTLRYALVGMVFEAEIRVRRRFSTMLARLARLADEANLRYTTLAPQLRRTPLDPLRMRLDEFLFMTMATADRWTDRGWSEEQQGRRLARTAAVSVMDELLDYMARNPEVRELIEQQGIGMAESAVDEVRERTASADLWIERLAHNLLRRPVSEKPAKPADTIRAFPPDAKAAALPLATTGQTTAPAAKGRRSAPAAQAEILSPTDTSE